MEYAMGNINEPRKVQRVRLTMKRELGRYVVTDIKQIPGDIDIIACIVTNIEDSFFFDNLPFQKILNQYRGHGMGYFPNSKMNIQVFKLPTEGDVDEIFNIQ